MKPWQWWAVLVGLLTFSASSFAQSDPDVVLMTDKLLFAVGLSIMFALGFIGGNQQ